jgi:hypothetical protein
MKKEAPRIDPENKVEIHSNEIGDFITYNIPKDVLSRRESFQKLIFNKS